VSAPSRLVRWAPWWGLLIVPSAFLASLSAAYAVVGHACSTGHQALVYIAPAIAAVIAVIGLLLSGWSVWRTSAVHPTPPPGPGRFLATISLATAALFLLATLVQWYVAAALSPCLQ